MTPAHQTCSQCRKQAKFKIKADGQRPCRYLCQENFQKWVDEHKEIRADVVMYSGAIIYAGKRTDES
jgi:hypothetical protein